MSTANQLRFNLTADQIQTEAEALIASSKAVHDAVAALPESERTFAKVVLPIAADEARFHVESNNLTFPSYVYTDKTVRDASTEADKKLENYGIEALMREDVAQALLHVKNNEFSSLTDDQRRLLTKMLRDYERNGLLLSPEKREQLKPLKKELAETTIQFSKNISDDKTELYFSREELEGLPEDYFKDRKQTDDGKYVVTLKYPDIVPIMEYASNPTTRATLERVRGTQCMEANIPLMQKAIKLRQQIAELLGYETHAHYVLVDRMAKHPQNVLDFLTNLKDKLKPYGEEALKGLLALKKEETAKRGLEFDGKINAWDSAYYQRILKETRYEIDEQQIKQYFPVEQTVEGLLSITQDLFGLRFVEVQNPSVWHEEVRMFDVMDKESGELVGQFYLDLFPREGKYTHAAAFPLQSTFVDTETGDRRHAVSAMVCNFTKPTPSQPSLLKHSEVVTLWHEFGHLCHGFCSKAKYSRFSGTSVERDFVECPSQLLENWCWQKDALKAMSSHYQTKEPLHDDIIEKLIAAKNANAELFNLRQLFFGIFDMTIHTARNADEAAAINLDELYSRLRKEISLVENTPGTNPAATFGHLMGGYDVGYYGYMYSLVFAADMFSCFKQQGVFNSDLGKKYRRTVLEVGGMKDGETILREFLGREPSNAAFLESIGLAASN